MNFIRNYHLLVDRISQIGEVLSIGKSGGEKLPVASESDIDLFVFCSEIPSAVKRRDAIEQLGNSVTGCEISEKAGRFWGFCDFVFIGDAEICLMYFTTDEMDRDIEPVLNGSRLDREDEYYYPTGRCASFLSMHILCDKQGYIKAMQEKLSVYPEDLSKKLFEHHIRKINDEEDFERAVSRRDVLFYHATLESVLDHFLQALFAVNHRFFPSRKRTLEWIERFENKPENCSERLLKVISLGTARETLSESYEIWCGLCDEMINHKNKKETCNE